MGSMSDGRLKARQALVTGAGSGNGAAIAQRLCMEGADVVLLDLNPEGLNRTLASWPTELRSRATPYVADITGDAEVAAAFADLARLDILVNNAGIADP